jgi:DeoR family myo-inositol catabolism operon transcriptional repressor
MRSHRLNELEAMILAKRTVSIDELCNTFGISKNTVRRDLAELEKRGTIARVYGGVTAVNSNTLAPYEERQAQNKAAKEIIGKLAADFVENGDTIFVDSGTTTVELIPYLVKFKELTVITHSMLVLSLATKYPNVTTVAGGGQYNPSTASFFGSETMTEIGRFFIRKAFLSTTGLSIEAGMTNHTYQEMMVKNKIIERSDKLFLMVDSSKIGKNASRSVSPMSVLDVFITDQCPPMDIVKYCKEHNIEVVYPKNGD